jgi:L-asparagine transporter-like permease
MSILQVSQIGQFEAEMSSDSFQLLGMAERGFLPACLARRSRYQTPTVAIVLSSIGICTLSMFDFRQVMVMHMRDLELLPHLYSQCTD